MTTLISWIGVDQRGVASIYIASDSKISWSSTNSWNSGKKLFSSKDSPEIFGFCGDVTFSSTVLAQLCDQIDSGLLKNCQVFEQKLEKIWEYISSSFACYPQSQRSYFEILYASRIGAGLASKFFAAKICWLGSGSVFHETLSLPTNSGLIEGFGSGKLAMKDKDIRWRISDVGRTSRSVFGAFCDALKDGEDPRSGGSPQLIGLYRAFPPIQFGIIWGNERYLSGALAPAAIDLDAIEWRNSLFERCDPHTLSIKTGAQRQPRPKIYSGKL
jgi:hypothetical protein